MRRAAEAGEHGWEGTGDTNGEVSYTGEVVWQRSDVKMAQGGPPNTRKQKSQTM
jgi:hypothetical protein